MKEKYLVIPTEGPMKLIDIEEKYPQKVKDLKKAIKSDCFDTVISCKFPLPRKIVMIVDDIGKLEEKEINIKASLLYGELYDWIVGDAVIGDYGTVNGEQDIIPPSAETLNAIYKLFNIKRDPPKEKDDCYYYTEVQEMNARIPTCDYYEKLEYCPCENCKIYIKQKTVKEIVKQHQKTKKKC